MKSHRKPKKTKNLDAENLAILRREIAALAFLIKQTREAAIHAKVGTDRILDEVRT